MPLGHTSCDALLHSVSISSLATFFEWSWERKTFISIYGISFKLAGFPSAYFLFAISRLNDTRLLKKNYGTAFLFFTTTLKHALIHHKPIKLFP